MALFVRACLEVVVVTESVALHGTKLVAADRALVFFFFVVGAGT